MLVCAVIVLGAGPARASDYTVGTTNDSSSAPCATPPCSLRQLITTVNTSSFPPDTIHVPAGAYTLSAGLGTVAIDHSVSIVGAGANQTTIAMPVPSDRSTSGSRVFTIAAPSGGATPVVTISGVKVTGGTANPSNGFFGGDIRNFGILTLADDWIADGYACTGGGIANQGTLTVTRTLISGNTSPCAGGDSGGIASVGTPGSPDLPAHLVLDDSTVAGNDARLVGGVFSWGDPTNTALITNSTIAGNTAKDEAGGLARGPGAGLAIGDGAGRIENSLLAGNVETTSGVTTPTNCAVGATLTSLGHNIDSGSDCAFGSGGDHPGANPQLGPLAPNGGPTQTLAIAATSPALDAADTAACPATDQRGVGRPQGTGCDIGAFELEVHALTVSTTGKGTVTGAAISCPPTCSHSYTTGSVASLTAKPSAGSKFAGWSGACSGTGACQVTLSADRQVGARFTLLNAFRFGKVKLNKSKGTAKLTVDVPNPGTLALAGKGLRAATKHVKAAGAAKLLVKPSGKTRKKLLKRGKASVTAKVTFTPTGGSPKTQSKRVKLVLTG
jgi:hypothetical protein